jgi:hypothetical protein
VTPSFKRSLCSKDLPIGGADLAKVEYAKMVIEEMAIDSITGKRNGTIGVEISVKDGALGKVKRLQIDFR